MMYIKCNKQCDSCNKLYRKIYTRKGKMMCSSCYRKTLTICWNYSIHKYGREIKAEVTRD